jgi:hypothetical protein
MDFFGGYAVRIKKFMCKKCVKTILLSSPESDKARIFRDFPAFLPPYTGAATAGADIAVANK